MSEAHDKRAQLGLFCHVQTGNLYAKIGFKADAPKLYKQFTGSHLTIGRCDGQTLAWKVGTQVCMITTLPASSPASGLASLPHFNRPTYLMCPPEWYDVDYVINPWMAGNLHRSSRDTAFMQWKNLYQELQRIADVRVLHAREGSPDMVFVAHAALVQHGIAAISSFAHPQRQTEEKHLRQWLEDAGFLLWATPRETCFEGEGDALFDANGGVLWAAHGVRTCRIDHPALAVCWGTPADPLPS